MKRSVAARVVLLICAALLLSFCKLDLNASSEDPFLNITAEIVYLSTDSVSIQFRYAAEDDRHLCRYDLSRKNGSAYEVVYNGEEQFNANQSYDLVFDNIPGDGAYRFSFTVLAERNGTYQALQFLQQSVEFWVDTQPPAEKVSIDPRGGTYGTERKVTLNHPELDSPEGSPVQIYYTLDGTDPSTASAKYDPGTPVAVADLAARREPGEAVQHPRPVGAAQGLARLHGPDPCHVEP